MQEAGVRAEKMLDDTLAAVRPAVTALHAASGDIICTDFKNVGTGAGSVTRERAVVTIISAERRGNFLGVVERHWRASGYRITSVREDKEMPAVFATSPEHFQISLEFGAKGQAHLGVTSPCVTKSEIVEPSREPLPPEARAAEGMPYLHSGFWSARTPVPSPSASDEKEGQ
ncbi:hypothetical protein [Streptomyces sp. NPDC047097]|uniref:hypothetical protein n=1 Tax=Streptomyces sp. NPDC047097 TaxID=3155260 RepID=UPI0033FCDF5D